MDTSILLYLYSDADPRKQKRASDLFRQQRNAGVLVSIQVVQEFYAAVVRKLGIPRSTAREVVNELLDLPLITISPALIRSAIDNEVRYQISFWDSLILAAAEAAGGVEVRYIEDLNDGQRYGGVVALNQFRN